MLVLHIFDGGPWWYKNFASLGYVSVELFFVLSGFILVYVYNDTLVMPVASGRQDLPASIPHTSCRSWPPPRFSSTPCGMWMSITTRGANITLSLQLF